MARLLLTIAFFACLPLAGFAQDMFVKRSLKEAMENSKNENKPLFIELNTTWCQFCKEMEAVTFSDPSVLSYTKNHYVTAQFDAEKGDGKVLADNHKANSYPTLLFFSPDGDFLGKYSGFQDAEMFLYTLEKFKAKSEKKMAKKNKKKK